MRTINKQFKGHLVRSKKNPSSKFWREEKELKDLENEKECSLRDVIKEASNFKQIISVVRRKRNGKVLIPTKLDPEFWKWGIIYEW